MVVPIIGSMAVKGVFNAGKLMTGIDGLVGKLKKTQMISKSTTTEMKRMTASSNQLRKMLALIGVTGFTALLMQSPQLAGALAKIKTQMTLLAWSIGKYLKPALDSVAKILLGIRTGDWSTVKEGIGDLVTSIAGLVGKTIEVVVKPVLGEKAAEKVKTDFINYIEDIKKAYETKGFWSAIGTAIIEPFKWVVDNDDAISKAFGDIGDSIASVITPNWMKDIAFQLQTLDYWIGEITRLNKLLPWLGTTEKPIRKEQVGGMIPSEGLYHMHAGEKVTPNGASPMVGVKKTVTPNGASPMVGVKKTVTPNGASPTRKEQVTDKRTTNITVDFSGANINLANGVDLDSFADAISLKIAENQSSRIY